MFSAGEVKTAAAAALVLVLSAGPSAAQDDPSLRFQQAAMAAFRAGNFAEAVQQLRAARFLTLDNPPRHLEVLARLALAEDAAKMTAARDGTLERFYEAERRLGAFAAASLEPDLRARFLALAEGHLGRQRIMDVPTLAAEFGFIPVRPTRPARAAAAIPPATPTALATAATETAPMATQAPPPPPSATKPPEPPPPTRTAAAPASPTPPPVPTGAPPTST